MCLNILNFDILLYNTFISFKQTVVKQGKLRALAPLREKLLELEINKWLDN